MLYNIISYLLHPILFSTIASFLYFMIVPNHIPKDGQRIILTIVFATTYIIPVLLSYFLKQFKLIENYRLKTIQERKFPVIFMILLFFLLAKLLLDTKIVDLLAFSFIGCAISLIIVYILFAFKIKSSLHTLSVAGIIGFLCVLSYSYKINLLPFIIAFFFVFGIVALARLKLQAHKEHEIYVGFLIGFISQLAIYFVYLKYASYSI